MSGNNNKLLVIGKGESMNAKPTAHKAKQVQQYLMSGVSYMIPVVVTGGVLYAIATMLSMS